MIFGLLMSVYDAMDYLEKCLESWVSFRQNGKHALKIAIIHNCFKENNANGEPIRSLDGTIEYLEKLKANGLIDFFEVLNLPSLEHEARNIPLDFLLKE